MADLRHVLIGPAFDGSQATVEVFRETSGFRWVLTTEGKGDTQDITEDFVPYVSGEGSSDEDDYQALFQALTSTLPGLGVPDFPDLFREVPPMQYLMSQLPPEMLEGVEIYTTSDLLAMYGEDSQRSDKTEERHQRNAEGMTESPGGHTGDSLVTGRLVSSEVAGAIAGQASWAARNGLVLNPNGTGLLDREAGIFGGIRPDTRAELAAGAGGELDRVHSLRSSTALVLNVFQPWRNKPRLLGELFGAKGASSLSFEATQPIWPVEESSKRKPPHFDVLITGPGPAVGIESKFLELYSPATNQFASTYFPQEEFDPPLWSGLPACRHLAERITAGTESFTWLPAAQLLKHGLGLSKNQPDGFRLVLVWYRIEGPTAHAIEAEIGRFARAVSTDLEFTVFTYQDLITRLAPKDPPAEGYFEYLADRYNLGPEAHRQLPLISLATRPKVNHKSGLAENIAELNPAEIVDAYFRSITRAPQRPLVRKPFLGSHDGAGRAAASSREKVAAKAIFNSGSPLLLGSDELTILDYEVPLRARQADKEVGEIDLLGLDTADHPWVIELKVAPNSDTPLKALYQGLRYSAILDANRQAITTEVLAHKGASPLWPGVIAVAADSAYWGQWDHPKAGDWLSALKQLADRITSELGVEIVLLDLGAVETEVADGSARLTAPLDLRTL
jgi:hypothetical protein